MKTRNDFELIEAFFDDDLSLSEKEIFDEKLKNDPEFAKNFKFRKTIVEHLRKANNYQKTKKNVAGILNARKTISISSKTYFAIAASILILFGIFIIIKQYDIKNDDILVEQEIDTLEYITSEMVVIPEKAGIYIYGESMNYNIEPGQFLQISNYNEKTHENLPDTLKPGNRSGYLLNYNVIYIYKEDGLTDTIFYTTADTVAEGKYMYLNDSMVEGDVYWKLRSLKKTNKIKLILRDSLRNKI